ncbi:MAG: hypothetical protein ACI38O_05570 [Fibrobacter intestinalis]
MKKRWMKLFVAALLCVGMWGCGLFDEDVTTTVDDVRSSGTVVAILDDSLVILKNSRGWEEHAESCDYYDSCDKGTMNHGIFLVDYRNKRLPYWGDTAKGIYHIINGLAYDSTIFFYNDENKFGLWKISKSIDVRGEMKWSEECDGKKNIQNVRPWKKGDILLEGTQNCPYAILDTATGNVKKLDFAGEYAWLEGCDDITYIDGNVVCLKALYDEKKYGLYEYGEMGLMDSLVWNDASWSIYTKNILEIRGGMFTIKHPTKMIDGEPNPLNGIFIHYLKPLGTPDSPVRMESNNFIDSKGISIGYSSEDLIVTK